MDNHLPIKRLYPLRTIYDWNVPFVEREGYFDETSKEPIDENGHNEVRKVTHYKTCVTLVLERKDEHGNFVDGVQREKHVQAIFNNPVSTEKITREQHSDVANSEAMIAFLKECMVPE